MASHGPSDPDKIALVTFILTVVGVILFGGAVVLFIL